MDQVDCKTVVEFLDALSPLNSRWRAEGPHEWVFRGQRQADKKLLPSAHRERTKLRVGPHDAASGPLNTHGAQAWAEWNTFAEFGNIVDELGLRIPGDGWYYRTQSGLNDLESCIQRCEFPPDHALEGLALAQHHGVPTRLLDFTRSPYVAAWFATQKADANDVGACAVWAFDMEHLRHPNLVKVGPARAGNRNLHAQKGLFLFSKYPRAFPNAPFTPEPLDDLVASIEATDGVTRSFKITLPLSLAPQAVKELELLGVTKATLMPSYDSAAEFMNSRL